MKAPKSLRALFSLPGFIAASQLVGVFGDRYARVIVLKRQKKRRLVRDAGVVAGDATTSAPAVRATCQLAAFASTLSSNAGGSTARGAAACT